MNSRPLVSAGTVLMVIGVLHTVVGLLLGATPLAAIVSAGYVGAVDGYFDRLAIFWFLMFGAVLMLLGEAFRWMEQSPQGVPSRIGWQLGVVCLAGAAAMPVSGFWLGLIPSALIIVRAQGRRVRGGGAVTVRLTE